jgi:hypothetical protein
MATLPEGFVLEETSPTAQPLGAPLPEGFVIETPEALSQIANDKGVVAKIDKALLSIPGVPTLTEFAAGFNRSALGMLDFLGPDVANNLLTLAGRKEQVPTFVGTAQKYGAALPRGSAAGPGITTDIAAGVGEVLPAAITIGQLFRSAAQQLPKFAAQSESAIRGMFRQAGSTTAQQDLAYGAMSATGAEVGESIGGDTGAFIGSFLSPLLAIGAYTGLKTIFNRPQGFVELTKSMQGMSNDGAASLLADAMIRENMTPDDVLAQLAQLGPNAIPADVNNSFARLLKAAANMIPRIEGRAAQVLDERQAGQANRLASGLDNALGVPGLGVDDEILRLKLSTQPQITALYEAAAEQPLAISGKLRTLFEGRNSLADAYKSALRRVADKRAAGDVITNFSIIDATKQQLDDSIGVALRAGEKNRARDLARLKNLMVAEADEQIPGYREARQMFAGQAALESAADHGLLFMRMTQRELAEHVKTMGESELRMFRLGAKQALFDAIDKLPVGSDATKRLFGKNGDIAKLSTLFPDAPTFENFRGMMEQEANFALTRRAVTGNSTTAKQAVDVLDAQGVINSTRALLGDPTAIATEIPKIINGIGAKRGSAVYKMAMEKAGDLLLESGIDPVQLQKILRAGDSPRVQAMLESMLPSPLSAVGRTTISTGAVEAERMLAPQAPVSTIPTAPPQARVQPTASPAARGLPYMTNQQAAAPTPPPAPASPQSRQMLQQLFPNDAVLQAIQPTA